MKIRFDFRIFLSQEHGGISRYFINLYTTFLTSNIDVKIWSPFYINAYLRHHLKRNLIFLKIKKENIILLYFVRILSKIIEQTFLIFSPPDIYHLTYYDYIPYHRKKTKIIVTVYDMIHELYPNEFDINASIIKRKCLSKADLIICISENTKADLIRLFDIDEKKVKIIYLGFSMFNSAPININPPKILNTPYILFVGQRSGYKNFISLIKFKFYN